MGRTKTDHKNAAKGLPARLPDPATRWPKLGNQHEIETLDSTGGQHPVGLVQGLSSLV
jgi:hypothetical protein